MPATDASSIDDLRSGPADVVLVGARVLTPDGRPADALAVRGGRIAFVGAEAGARALAGTATRLVRLQGGLLVPGFQDAHCHPPTGGLAMAQADLHDAGDEGAYLAIIARWAAEHPDATWVVGDGWFMGAFPGGNPSRAALDAVVPDRPVYAESRDGHSAWVNSRALALAGITAATPDPADGVIVRDEHGEPWGTLHEGANGLVSRLIPPPTADEWVEAILRAQAHLHSLGITAWQDAIVRDDTGPVYRRMAEEGILTARVVGALWWERDRGDEQVAEMVDRRAAYTHGRFRATSVKLMQDGIPENFTAGMLDPYLDLQGRPSERRGLSFIDPEALARYASMLDAAGFQCHFHAIGDRAVREALDALEAALRANGRSDLRHHVSHIEVIHPDDVPRFAALGVVANAQPYWACFDGQMETLVTPFLGPERSAWQYPFRSLLRSGARMAMGSDWAVTTPNPLLEMEVAVTRVLPETRDREPFYPQERIELGEALAAFTLGSAYVNHLDGETGTVEEGKLADLAVLDRDPFAPGAGPVGDARVVLTLVDGEPVHADPAAVSW